MLYLVTSQYYQFYLALTKNTDNKSKVKKTNTETNEDRSQLNPGSVGV